MSPIGPDISYSYEEQLIMGLRGTLAEQSACQRALDPTLSRQVARKFVRQRLKIRNCRPNPITRTIVVGMKDGQPVTQTFRLGHTFRAASPKPKCRYQRALLDRVRAQV